MLMRKFRRNNKEPYEVINSRPREDSAVTLPAPIATNAGLNFFDLPAELRNAIYDFVISDATLSLPSSVFSSTSRRLSKLPALPLRRRKSLAQAPINGLLLASRQCRREYLTFLLSTVEVVVEVKDFDFESLMRVSSGLGDLEAKALESNPNLKLHLITQNCTTKDLTLLRRWLDYRHAPNGLSGLAYLGVSLPWKYEFPLEKLLPPTTMGRVRLLRELEYYADTVSTLEVDVAECQREELKAIILAFESKALWLEDDLGWLGERSKSAVRNLRGLAGGGVH